MVEQPCHVDALSEVGQSSLVTTGIVTDALAPLLLTRHATRGSVKKISKKSNNKISKKKNIATAKKRSSVTKQKVVLATSASDTECLVCGENFDEQWIQCFGCKRWAHEECADISDTDYYFCDLCSSNSQSQ